MKLPNYTPAFNNFLPDADTIPKLLDYANSLEPAPLPVFRNVTAQRAPDPDNSHFRETLLPVPVQPGIHGIPAMSEARAPDPCGLRVRVNLIERLTAARHYLPADLDLVVLDGWQPRHLVEHLLDWQQEFPPRLIGGIPFYPHGTGGAVDLTIAFQGVPVTLGSPYYSTSARAHLYAYEGLGGPLRALRRVYASALLNAGFAPSGRCWWHWEYGTPRWAAWYGEEPRYGLVAHVKKPT